MNEKKGWISLYRKTKHHWLWPNKSYTKLEAWVDLLIEANHAENRFDINGTLITVARGQQARSQLTLSKEWGWSINKVKRFLKRLESGNMIVIETNQLTTLITICNYSNYQDSEKQNESTDEKQTDQRPSNGRITNNNVNNVNNDNKTTSSKKLRFSDNDMKLAEFMSGRIKKLYPEDSQPKHNLEKWADTIRITVEQDKRTHKQLQDVFIWANQDSFWQKNLLSPTKLREKYSDLILKMQPARKPLQVPDSGDLIEFAEKHDLPKPPDPHMREDSYRFFLRDHIKENKIYQ